MPIGSIFNGAASVFSAGVITIGTLNEDRSSRNVGCATFLLITKVCGSGASQDSTLARMTFWMPTLA